MSKRTEGQLVTDVLTHWFGSTTVSRFDPLQQQLKLWYGGSEEIDDDIRQRFGEDVKIALNGGWDHLIGGKEHPLTGELALVILLDQYTRNVFRGTAQAYSGDEKVIQVAASIVTTERWSEAKETLAVIQCSSFLLPFMHQESVHQLDICVEKVSDLLTFAQSKGEEAEEVAKWLENMLKYAHEHRDIVVQFGRYPYRNEVLGRTSTPEELKFLEEGPRFGQ